MDHRRDRRTAEQQCRGRADHSVPTSLATGRDGASQVLQGVRRGLQVGDAGLQPSP
ncbi:hypothetical protein [Streptomyces lunalinharesii]|uniref:hypothetical protein n=1 Tax=Streptomyces lunalinharesii TaxID=333384 RepID=UPI0031DCAB39